MLNSDRHLNINLNRQLDGSGSDPAIVTELSIAQSQAMPIFAEAAAQAALLLEAPLAILTTIGAGDRIGAISGIEKLVNLPPQPNLLLELAGVEYCHERAISSSKFEAIDCLSHPQLAQSPLVRVHGIGAYLGVPIITAARDRLGTLAILDFKPRQFSDREVDLLQLVSSLVASQFERTMLSQAQLTHWLGKFQYRSTPGFDDRVAATEHLGTAGDLILARSPADELATAPDPIYPHIQGEIQFKLLTHLARELRTPLTSILGMASVLQQEIYGELSHKQKDYLGIIHQSGQQLVAIVDEISQLGEFAPPDTHPAIDLPDRLTLKSVDLDMLCQLALQSLEPLAQKKHQQIAIDLAGNGAAEPINRIWLLDKEKVRQIIYYLCLSALHASNHQSRITIELVNLTDAIQLQIGTDDLEAILPPVGSDLNGDRSQNADAPDSGGDLRISLGLSLSYLLALAHGGKIELSEDLHCYHLTLPLIPGSMVTAR
jgi:signal transduction histidine kinase